MLRTVCRSATDIAPPPWQADKVTRTGARARALDQQLVTLGHTISAVKPPVPRLATMPAATAAGVLDLYRQLGGVQEAPRLAPGSWDIVTDGGLLIELDEEFHFTRYRTLTLGAEWECELPWAPDWRRYAAAHEHAAIAPGGRWANPSAAAMFGGSDPYPVFGAHGPARWKQRALYDAMKDAVAAEVGLVRLSIYDRLGDTTLGAVLTGRATPPSDKLERLIAGRSAA